MAHEPTDGAALIAAERTRQVAAEGAPRQRKELEPCGTYGGYQRHIRARETTCAPCRAANTAYKKVQWVALRRLAERHPEEFAALLEEARQEVR